MKWTVTENGGSFFLCHVCSFVSLILLPKTVYWVSGEERTVYLVVLFLKNSTGTATEKNSLLSGKSNSCHFLDDLGHTGDFRGFLDFYRFTICSRYNSPIGGNHHQVSYLLSSSILQNGGHV